MLDWGWDRRCFCQISAEPKRWRASDPLGTACMSARWKQLGAKEGGNSGAICSDGTRAREGKGC